MMWSGFLSTEQSRFPRCSTFGIRARHVGEVKDLDGSTHVKTVESFEGWLARLFPGLIRKMLRQALDGAIGSLKAEFERGPAKG